MSSHRSWLMLMLVVLAHAEREVSEMQASHGRPAAEGGSSHPPGSHADEPHLPEEGEDPLPKPRRLRRRSRTRPRYGITTSRCARVVTSGRPSRWM